MKLRAWWTALAVCALPLLHACGGSEDNSSDSAVRLVNVSDSYATLDLYLADVQQGSSVATDAAGSYASVDAATYTVKLKSGGSSTTSNASTRTFASGMAYTLVAYTTGEALKMALLEDAEAAPSSGTAKLRVFNTSTEAGSVDVYVTDASATLSASTAATSALAGERLGSYNEFSAGTYRIRVTGTGDKTDLRLDIPSVTLADQQIATLVLTSGSGGVLVHGHLLNQKGTLSAQRNTAARIRLAAGAASHGSVAATVNGTALTSGMTSPAVGNYVLVTAGTATFDVKLNGSTASVASAALQAGSDSTLLVTGTTAAPAATVLTDDNRPASSASATQLRLVHGVTALASPITLTADYSAVATDVAANSASTPASLTAGTTFRLEATSPGVSGSMFLATDVTLAAARVYTLFMLGDAAAATGVLRRDR